MAKHGCYGKLSYATRRLCDRAIARIKRRTPAKGNKSQVSSYYCPSCGGWHFGHISPVLERRTREQRRRLTERGFSCD